MKLSLWKCDVCGAEFSKGNDESIGWVNFQQAGIKDANERSNKILCPACEEKVRTVLGIPKREI